MHFSITDINLGMDSMKEYVSLERLRELVTWENLWAYKYHVTGTDLTTRLLLKLLSRPRNLPPGPIGLPVIGAAYKLSSEMHNDFLRMGDKYGDVFCMSILGK